MADEFNESWRVQLGVRPGLDDGIPPGILRTVPRSDIYVGDHTVILYPSAQAEARVMLSEQAANADVIWVELAKWDTPSASWRTVEAVGRRDDSTATGPSTPKWKPGTWPLMAAVFVLTAAVMFLLAYFLPTADGHHNLPKAIAVAIFVGLICVVGSLFTTRRYTPPPP